MAADASVLAETRALLERTPAVLRLLLTDLPDGWLESRDGPDGWRPRDVVGHFISAELDDWIPRVRHILEHGDSRPFEPFDRFAHEQRDAGRTLAELLDEFERLRSENLVTLEELVSAEDLDRKGLHPSLGSVTMGELLATWAIHDLDHLRQVMSALAYDHTEAVGAWRGFLGIVDR